MKHTPEPWNVTVGTLDDEKDIWIKPSMFFVHDDTRHVPECYEQHLAEAHRIVACVNACAGVANPAAIPAVIEACRMLLECRTGDGLLDPASELFRQAKEALERLSVE